MTAFFSSTPKNEIDQARDNAYQKGRLDERAKLTDGGGPKDADLAAKKAYERGRRDERARRHGSPVLTGVLVLAAAAGAFVIYLAVSQGSFARGGQVVDQSLSGATNSASQTAQDAKDRAAQALQDAGAKLKGQNQS
jgi:hypothetical protein